MTDAATQHKGKRHPQSDQGAFSATPNTPTMKKTQAVGLSSYMATITYLNGKRVFTYSNDHIPAHVHVSSNGCRAKFELNCESGPAEYVSGKGYSDPELNLLKKNLTAILGNCCQHWKDNYGDYT